MCSREEIKEIIDLSIAKHEISDIKRHAQFEEKLDKTLIAVRDSIPPSFSALLKDITRQIEELRNEVKPVVTIVETTKTLRTMTIWIAGFLLALYPIVEGFRYIKKLFNS